MSGLALNAAVGAPLLDHVVVRHGTERYWRVLKEVLDPELPISVVDMGLIYDIEEPEAGALRVTMTYDLSEAVEPASAGTTLCVTMTFTATACPCMSLMEMDIRDRLLKEPGVASVDIRIVWDPPWSRRMLTEEGKATLRKYGVAA